MWAVEFHFIYTWKNWIVLILRYRCSTVVESCMCLFFSLNKDLMHADSARMQGLIWAISWTRRGTILIARASSVSNIYVIPWYGLHPLGSACVKAPILDRASQCIKVVLWRIIILSLWAESVMLLLFTNRYVASGGNHDLLLHFTTRGFQVVCYTSGQG